MINLEIKQILREIMNELGFDIGEIGDEDINLQNYLVDSIQFISFVVAVEETLRIEFPDELLLYDSVISINGLSNLLEEIID